MMCSLYINLKIQSLLYKIFSIFNIQVKNTDLFYLKSVFLLVVVQSLYRVRELCKVQSLRLQSLRGSSVSQVNTVVVSAFVILLLHTDDTDCCNHQHCCQHR